MDKKLQITLKNAIKAHLIHCQAAGYSQHTLADYENTFSLLVAWLGTDEVLLDAITPEQMRQFIADMAQQPFCSPGSTKKRKRSPKTLLNYHIALSSLWTFATQHSYAQQHIMQLVAAPRVHQPAIQPLTNAQVKALLQACRTSAAWHNKPGTTSARPTAQRDAAIVAVLVETAIRADELVQLKVSDVIFNTSGGQLTIQRGKGHKKRWVPFSKRCAKYLHSWLMARGDYAEADPLFCNVVRNAGLPLTRHTLASLLKRLSKKAGLPSITPHKLRTTAACLLVQNGISAWQLQRIMGHSDINTTMRYVRAAAIDLDAAMASASPLDNMRL